MSCTRVLCGLTCAGLLLLVLPLENVLGEEGKKKPKHTNMLARESSPYLLQHAHNPVNWYPWGPEAFAKAKKEGKLVFLSIGYSSCHWCHVMEKESFANEEVAKLLNKHFVCIKVDREERPDVDQIYMAAMQHVLGRQGGWPLSMFLTAEGKPIFGGTYWPREDRTIEGQTVSGFKTILKRVQEFHTKEGKALEKQAETVAKATQEALTRLSRGKALIELDRKLVTASVDELKERFDPMHGGFGNPRIRFRGTKFPTPSKLMLLEHEARRTKSTEFKKILAVTLDHMARGGIYDHLGGGFHRYSTERTWTVPHFEKMLYDNAQLLEVYGKAYERTKKPQYARVLRETISFVGREMTSPEGAFYSALDADSEGEEGRFYVWTKQEIAQALPTREDRELLGSVYGTDGAYNFEGKYHILTLPKPIDELARDRKLTRQQLWEKLIPLRKKLFAVRSKRERPFLDTKVLTAWNGQMIAGLARAGAVLKDKDAIERAERAANFILKTLKNKEGRLLRTYGAAPGKKPTSRLNGYLDDYAYLVHGLLTLHDVTGKKRWLEESKTLTDTMVKFHMDRDNGGFFYTSHDHEKLFARGKDPFDGAQPSGNSIAARNLVRLWAKTGSKRFGELAEKTFKGLSVPLKMYPGSLTAFAHALALYLEMQKK